MATKKVTPVAKKAASVAKKTVAKKVVAPAKKAEATKEVVTPVKKVVAKKVAVSKKATVAKKTAETKPTAAKKTVAKKTTINTKTVAKKTVSRRDPADLAQPTARTEISDAVALRPKKAKGKPGVVVAQRILKKVEKKDEDESLTMEKYFPNKKSPLDKINQDSGPIYRYSDEDLSEFKEIILKRLENAKNELSYLQGLITRKDEAGTEDTDNRFNHMEDGSGAMEREQLSQFAQRQVKFINNLENALVRIENKTYGICRVTGKLIDKARLRAVPHATLSIEAKQNR